MPDQVEQRSTTTEYSGLGFQCEDSFSLERERGIEGKLRRLYFPWRLFLGTQPIRPHPPKISLGNLADQGVELLAPPASKTVYSRLLTLKFKNVGNWTAM